MDWFRRNDVFSFQKSPRRCLLLSSLLFTTVVLGTAASDLPGDESVIEKLPYCGDGEPKTGTDRNVAKRLVYITTLDGQLSALDLSDGKMRWNVETGPGELLSSSIQNLELTNNGQLVRIIPALSGSLYQLTGRSVEAIPITAESLLSLSYKFSDDLVISGGKDTRSYGVSARNGGLIYECTMSGCRNESIPNKMDRVFGNDEGEENKSKSDHDLFLDDVVVIRRQTQTVRAIDPRTGVERWNFSVGNHELEVLTRDECHSSSSLDLSDIELRVVVPEGIICAYSKTTSDLLWQYQFEVPIVNAWRFVEGKFNKVDLFTSVQWLWESEAFPEFSTLSKNNPSIYIGLFNKQLYVQESESMKQRYYEYISNQKTDLILEEENRKPQKKTLSLPWKPLPAVKTALMVLDSGTTEQNLDEKEIMEQYALMTVNNQWNNWDSAKGFYLFDTEIEKKCQQDNETQDKGSNSRQNNETFASDGANQVSFVSLWYWWKEICVISVTSAVVLNIFLNNSAKKRLDNAKSEPEKENVIVERYIEIPIPVEKPSDLSGKTSSSQLSHIMGSSDSNFNSRFLSDFDMIQCLGKGGFGVVFEAKNKLDDCRYAIKRILLPNKKENRDRVMREVKTLANCEHQNIVRFFQAWVETPPSGWQENQDQFWLTHQDSIMSTSIDIETSEISRHIRTFNSGEIHNERLKSITPRRGIFSELKTNECLSLDHNEMRKTWFVSGNGKVDSFAKGDSWKERENEEEEDDSFIVFKHSTKGEEFSINDTSFSTNNSATNNSDSLISSPMIKARESELLSCSVEKTGKNPILKTTEKMYLYIQMQLCQKQSLKEWLQLTGEAERQGKIVPIFDQIIGAVEYVHLKGLIHRDLKPSNIFFAMDGTIKIGDFGLVTDMEDNSGDDFDSSDSSSSSSSSKEQNKDLAEKMNKKHTQQVGTHLYMSPEQIEGKPYDYKVDIYSLGLILFELLWIFSTEMERIKTLTSLRISEFPEDFSANFSSEFQLLKLMLSKFPHQRPTTFGIRARPPLNYANISPQLHFELPKRRRSSRSVSLSINSQDE